MDSANAFNGAPVRVITEPRHGHQVLLASRPLRAKETITISAPYVKTMGTFNRCKYCYHCHLKFEQQGHVKSAHTEDFFGFDSCRDLFDASRERAAAVHKYIVENVGMKFDAELQREKMYLNADGHRVWVDPSELDVINLALEALIKRDAEERGERDVWNRQVLWSGSDCRQSAPSEDPREVPYQPTFADVMREETLFASVPERELARLERLAEIVQRVLNATGATTGMAAKVTREHIVELLFSVSKHQRAIVRGQGREAKQTGRGLYPTADFYRLDSEPTCEYYFDENTNMVVRAATDLPENTLLTLGETPVALGSVRQTPPYSRWLLDA